MRNFVFLLKNQKNNNNPKTMILKTKLRIV